jgi:hypothetical protein
MAKPEMIPSGVPTLVFIPQPLAINVAYATATDPLRMQLVMKPGEELREAKISLEGPLESTGRVIDAGGWVEFPEVKVSGGVTDALSRHNRITEQITVRAETAEGPQVIGASNIELWRG